jgi:hypothetical protein
MREPHDTKRIGGSQRTATRLLRLSAAHKVVRMHSRLLRRRHSAYGQAIQIRQQIACMQLGSVHMQRDRSMHVG